MEYLTEALWYASWPVVIILSVKFVQLNLKHYEKMERLEELEALHAEHLAKKAK
jgi:hypothetical protein